MSNLLMISIDDLFSVNAWPEFRDILQTPNLDAFAAQSTNFTAAYAPVALCNPSRSAILSGHGAMETLIIDNTLSVFDRVPPADILFQRLADAGYDVTMGGKVFHSPYEPAMESFASNFLTRTGFHSGDMLGGDALGGLNYGPSDIVLADTTLTQSVVEFLGQAHTSPFVLAAGLFRPHADWVVPQKYFDMYNRADIKVPYFGTDTQGMADFYYAITGEPFHQQVLTADVWVDLIHAYLASVSYADDMFGQMIAALEASPYAADTNVVVWSDHGYHLGDGGHWHKFTLWEESGRAPLMIHTAGQTTGQVVDTPVSLEDIYPTVLDLMGVTGGYRGNGNTLDPFLGGAGTYEGNGAFTWMYGGYSLRMGDYRFIHNEDGSEHLYNIRTDWHQLTDLVANPLYADVLAQMQANLPTVPGHEIHFGSRVTETIDGTAGADIIVSGGGRDVLNGGAGDDVYFITSQVTINEAAGGGTDTVVVRIQNYIADPNIEIIRGSGGGLTSIQGNAQANLITTNSRRAEIHGAGGNDRIETAFGNDTIFGDAGHDRILSSVGNDTIDGGTGNDWINGESGADTIHGGEGGDTLIGDDGNDTLYGDGGYDVLNGGGGNDLMYGGDLADTMDGGAGVDTMNGGSGNDVMRGGLGADRIDGGTGDDQIDGGISSDRLLGNEGNDIVRGGFGDDIAEGGLGNDRLLGDAGNDTLYGMDGIDQLWGGAGDDALFGGAGNDRLYLDGGNDRATGGAGADVFYLEMLSGSDVIQDFENGIDRIDLALMGYAGFQALQSHFVQGAGYVDINLGTNGSIRLMGVTLDQLDATDFILAHAAADPGLI